MSDQRNAETLLALSEIDMSILRMQKQLDELPHRQQIIEVRSKSRKLEGKAKQVEKLAADAARTVKLLADEADLNEKQIAQTQAALDVSSEYRETSVLVAEMEMLANRKAKLEEDALASMEKQEKVAQVEAQIIDAAKRLAQEEQAYTNAYREAGGKLKQQISDLEQARKTLVPLLSQELGERYMKALENKAGIGVASLVSNQCSGCYSTLSEGQLAKLQEGPQIAECPNCNRLIVT